MNLIALALRNGSTEENKPQEQQDLLAFVALALGEIASSVDQTAAAWEKRGFWLKADRFRVEWDWVEVTRASLEARLDQGDWAGAAEAALRVAVRLDPPSSRRRRERPWIGAWERWSSERYRR